MQTRHLCVFIERSQRIVDRIDKVLSERKQVVRDLEQSKSNLQDAKAFAGKVTDLAERKAPDLSALPVEQAVAEFNARLTRARKAKTQRQSLEKQGQKAVDR